MSRFKAYNTGGKLVSSVGATAASFIPGVGPLAAPLVGGVLGSILNKTPKAKPSVSTGYASTGYKYGGKMKYPYGGNLSSAYPIGNDAVRFEGPQHEQGGIPIDNTGNPTIANNAIAEVEGGETRQGDYIFSDELMVPESDMTFAEMHEMLLQQGAGEEEIEQLAQMQEQVKQQQGVGDASMGQPMFQDGGNLKKYPDGGRIGRNTHQIGESIQDRMRGMGIKKDFKNLGDRTSNVGRINPRLGTSGRALGGLGKFARFALPRAAGIASVLIPEDLGSSSLNETYPNHLLEPIGIYRNESNSPISNSNNKDFRFYEHSGNQQQLVTPMSQNGQAQTRQEEEDIATQTTNNVGNNTQSNARTRPTSPNVKPVDNIIEPNNLYDMPTGINRSNRSIEGDRMFNPQTFEESMERENNVSPSMNIGSEKGRDWGAIAQRFAPSITRLASAAFAPKPKRAGKVDSTKYDIEPETAGFRENRRRLEGAFRAASTKGSAQGAYARYSDAMNQNFANEAQYRSGIKNQNTRAKLQADMFNVQNEERFQEKLAQDTAGRIGLVDQAIQSPLTASVADKRGRQQMIANVMSSLDRVTDQTDWMNRAQVQLRAIGLSDQEIERIIGQYRKYGGKLKNFKK